MGTVYVCAECKAAFYTHHPRQKYCCEAHRKRYDRLRRGRKVIDQQTMKAMAARQAEIHKHRRSGYEADYSHEWS